MHNSSLVNSNRKNITEIDIFNTWYDKWIKIKRACNPLKTIVHEAISIISLIEYHFLRSPDENEVVFNSDLIKNKCIQGKKQRGRFLKQLADIYNLKYHRRYRFKGKTYYSVFVAKRTPNSKIILENPELFYSKKDAENKYIDGQKRLQVGSKTTTGGVKNVPALYIDNKEKTDNYDNQHNQFQTFNFFSSTEYAETKNIKVNNYKINKLILNNSAKKESEVSTERNTKTVEYSETLIASDYVLGHTTETEEYTKEYNFTDIPIEVLEGNTEYVETSENLLAKEECKDIAQAKNKAVEFVEKPESLKGTQSITSHYQTVEVKGKDGKTYKAPYLRDFRFTDSMIQTAISRSNKPHYTTGKVRVILECILHKKPNMQIYGGREGFIKYLVKLINGENDYEYASKYPQNKEEKALSMAEIQAEKQRAIDERFALFKQGKVPSLSGAERYYG